MNATPRPRHATPHEPCPALRAMYRAYALPVDIHARAKDLGAADVRLRCLERPGVELTADYVVDLCLGRAYGDFACLFAAGIRGEQARPLTWPAHATGAR